MKTAAMTLAAVVGLFFGCTALASGQYKAARYHAPRAAAYHAPRVSPVHVSGHVTRAGTYVQPHYRTAPDQSKANNWSSKPNVNPYTGKAGTVDPYSTGH